MASRKFVENFERVAAHYRLAEFGELEQAKEAARADMAGAIECFAALAAEIERIKK